MRIDIAAVGRLKAGPERDLVDRYVDRFSKAGPAVGLEWGRLVEIAESRASNAETRKRDEADAIAKASSESAVLILLDERGKALGSEEFTHLLGNYRDGGKREVLLAIGGADGHAAGLREKADVILSFGKMTWPHQMVRIMLCEQLYRSVTILSGHPYHRA